MRRIASDNQTAIRWEVGMLNSVAASSRAALPDDRACLLAGKTTTLVAGRSIGFRMTSAIPAVAGAGAELVKRLEVKGWMPFSEAA